MCWNLGAGILCVDVSDELVCGVVELEHVAAGAQLCGGAHAAPPPHSVDLATTTNSFQSLYAQENRMKKVSKK
jgi:hypothetical protein